MRKSFLLTETHFKIQPGYTLLCNIVDEVSKSLGDTYPELAKNNKKVKFNITMIYINSYMYNYIVGETFNETRIYHI